MTKTKIKTFFETIGLQKDDNNTYWHGKIGYVLFNKSLIVIRHNENDFPALLCMHSFKDINLLAKHEVKGVIVGSKKLTRESMA